MSNQTELLQQQEAKMAESQSRIMVLDDQLQQQKDDAEKMFVSSLCVYNSVIVCIVGE